MATTTDLSTLKINYLTDAQYQAALNNGTINENELYFTPGITITASTTDITAGTTALATGCLYLVYE